MRYREIPDTALNPSVICLGALPFGVSLSEEVSFALLDRFFAAGGNFVDTALVYGEWLPGGKGLSERTLGKWVQARGNRQQVIIGTKGAHPRLNTLDIQRLSRAEISADIEESLRNLQTDHIDLYWLHRDDPRRPVADILNTLNEQAQQGKIRYFGCSNWRVQRIREAQDYAIAHELQGFAGNQLLWSLAVPNGDAPLDPAMVVMDDVTKRYHLASGMAVMAYGSQANGLFSKLQYAAPAGLPAALRATYHNQENLHRMERLRQVAQQRSLPMSALVLSYLTAQPFPTYPLSACSNMAQLLENLQAGDIELAPVVVSYLANGA